MTGVVRRELRGLIWLALPLVLAQLAQTGLAFVDTLMVGRLGGEALAGIALGGVVFNLTLVVGNGVLLAVGPLVAQAFGAGDRPAVARSTRQGMWLALAGAVPGIALFLAAEPLLLVLGQQSETSALSAAYLRAMAWGFPAALVLAALRGFLEGIGDARPIMVITVAGLGLNVLANNALMFGRWGFPALGLVGTGYASALVYLTMMLAVAIYIRLGHSRFEILRPRPPDGGKLLELVRLGLPIGVNQGFEAGLFSVTGVLMGLIGSVELAAHQIAIQSASVTFTVAIGVSLATSVRVGQAVGRGEAAQIRLAGYLGIALSGGVLLLAAGLFRFAPGAVISLYLDTRDPVNAEVVRLATLYLGVAALFQLFDGVQVGAAGALRGLRDTRVPMVISLVAYWFIGMPVGVGLAFVAGFAGQGLWFGLVLGLAAAAVLLLRRFERRRSYLVAGGGTASRGGGVD